MEESGYFTAPRFENRRIFGLVLVFTEPVIGDLLGKGGVRPAEQPRHLGTVALRKGEEARDVLGLEAIECGRPPRFVEANREKLSSRGVVAGRPGEDDAFRPDPLATRQDNRP